MMMDVALSYAARGWPVLPLKHGEKRPHVRRGCKDASLNPGTIAKWWNYWPDGDIGIATGRLSGLAVLDEDPRAGGDKSLRDLEARYGLLPNTPTVRTGAGGRHFYFLCPDDGPIRSGKVAQGLDLKADGGYVVAPPSVHASGRCYQWEVGRSPEDLPLALLPRWLLNGEGGKRRQWQ